MRNPTTIRRSATLAPALALALLSGLATPAEAQFGGSGGFGGFGYGFGFNQNAYSDVNYLNQRSLQNGEAAAANRPQPLTAPQYQSRDDSLYDRYDLETRESMIDRIARDPAQEMGTASPTGAVPRPRNASKPKAPAAAAQPEEPRSVHLADFFNQDHQLVWPSASPISGDFGKKQETADLAALAVLNEYDLKGLASTANVAEARRKLLEYGRPALDQVRQQSTPALTDAFHVFLLSLYGNLGAAATVPKAK